MRSELNKTIRIVLTLLLICSCVYLAISLFQIYSMIGTAAEISSIPDPLEDELTVMFLKYKNNEIPNVDLSKATDFQWDKIYVFRAYSSLSEIDRKFGRAWQDVCVTQIETLESYTLLIFTQGGQVVHCLEYSTFDYDFSSLVQYSDGIPIQDAIFGLDEDGYAVLIKDK